MPTSKDIDVNKLNFTIGPVQSSEHIRNIGAEQVPYFRTQEFSTLMLENERLMKQLADAEANARVCFITGSGTASMEAVVSNCFTPQDRLLIINGGTFGHRFEELAEIYEIPHTTVHVEMGHKLTKEQLYAFDGQSYSALLVNMHETSTGVLYDMDMIADFCRKNSIFLVVDAISSFLCDSFSMKRWGVSVMIAASQKALACHPGISMITLSSEAVQRITSHNVKCLYLNLNLALSNGERGQTPFTPAISILRQLNARVKDIIASGGVEKEIQRVAALASDFRSRISDLPFSLFPERMSNALTAICPNNVSAYSIFTTLKDEYDIWVCPNGGILADKVLRVGHIGDLSVSDNTRLINALKDMQQRGLL
ncbi:MAG: aminotransferase class V-fold PLP-dependent enzyme [Bacteroidales bacterium]|nr:aminotransferase class V-fold PLP-dependent enzyme [Bacteroidales bacterium]